MEGFHSRGCLFNCQQKTSLPHSLQPTGCCTPGSLLHIFRKTSAAHVNFCKIFSGGLHATESPPPPPPPHTNPHTTWFRGGPVNLALQQQSTKTAPWTQSEMTTNDNTAAVKLWKWQKINKINGRPQTTLHSRDVQLSRFHLQRFYPDKTKIMAT